MEKILMNFIKCLDCSGIDLELNIKESHDDNIISGIISCRNCKRNYEIREGIVIALPHDLSALETNEIKSSDNYSGNNYTVTIGAGETSSAKGNSGSTYGPIGTAAGGAGGNGAKGNHGVDGIGGSGNGGAVGNNGTAATGYGSGGGRGGGGGVSPSNIGYDGANGSSEFCLVEW